MAAYAEGKRLGAMGDFLAALVLSTFVGSIVAANALVATTLWWLWTTPWNPVGWALLGITVSSSKQQQA